MENNDTVNMLIYSNKHLLEYSFNKDSNITEIGIDESGRGPLFGRVYVASVCLPNVLLKSDIDLLDEIRDSKKIKNWKKMTQLSDYIKRISLAWTIQYIEADQIDLINIRQATILGMRNCISQMILDINQKQKNNIHVLIDGCDFSSSYQTFNNTTGEYEQVPFDTVVSGDNKYISIACASILAKFARDSYIKELCKMNTTLSEYYSLDTNMGYGTKKHIDGIYKHGITSLHRKSFAPCSKISPN